MESSTCYTDVGRVAIRAKDQESQGKLPMDLFFFDESARYSIQSYNASILFFPEMSGLKYTPNPHVQP